MTARTVQHKLLRLLTEKGYDANIEWDVAKNDRRVYTQNIYAPRVDLAVKPFHTTARNDIEMEHIIRNFQDVLSMQHKLPMHFRRNQNPRCAIAVEIEASGSRKHMLGDILNAVLLGGIGIVVPLGANKESDFRRINNYINFAKQVGKIEENYFENLVILNENEFIDLVNALPTRVQN